MVPNHLHNQRQSCGSTPMPSGLDCRPKLTSSRASSLPTGSLARMLSGLILLALLPLPAAK